MSPVPLVIGDESMAAGGYPFELLVVNELEEPVENLEVAVDGDVHVLDLALVVEVFFEVAHAGAK
jgi:hypothetical protein